MYKFLILKLLIVGMLLIPSFQKISAQCAMCKAVVESNLNQKDQPQKVAKQLNEGIIYLMLIPYIVLCGIGYMLYKSRNDHKSNNAES